VLLKVGKQFKIPVARDMRLWVKDWVENQARPGWRPPSSEAV
jgi:hypothetical protein